ncbi:unnamed protein product, partial [Nesidiocoris tenuis]
SEPTPTSTHQVLSCFTNGSGDVEVHGWGRREVISLETEKFSFTVNWRGKCLVDGIERLLRERNFWEYGPKTNLFLMMDTSLDSRGGKGSGSDVGMHWKDDSVLDGRSYFRTTTEPATLSINNIQETDEAIYRCRVDFKTSQTRNYRVKLIVVAMENTIKKKKFKIKFKFITRSTELCMRVSHDIAAYYSTENYGSAMQVRISFVVDHVLQL